MTAHTATTETEISRLRGEVAALYAELTRYGLVAWTAGNVSGRVPGADLFVIKPSGVPYDDLRPESMILCDLDGVVVPGSAGSDRFPSSDTAAHAPGKPDWVLVGAYRVSYPARGERRRWRQGAMRPLRRASNPSSSTMHMWFPLAACSLTKTRV